MCYVERTEKFKFEQYKEKFGLMFDIERHLSKQSRTSELRLDADQPKPTCLSLGHRGFANPRVEVVLLVGIHHLHPIIIHVAVAEVLAIFGHLTV